MVCVSFLLVVKLLKGGVSQWTILSLSAPSALTLVIALYLFAFVRGASSTQHIQLEHPFTSTDYYMGFYVSTPLLGGLVGILMAMANARGIPHLLEFLVGLALWTLKTTIVVWIIIDPLAGLIEMLLPASRRHRVQRLADADVDRRIRQEKRERLLAEAFAREEQERQRWQESLRPHAERLAALSTTTALPGEQAEREALHIGALAWRLGGLTCMRQLRDMTLQLVEQQQGRDEMVDYISHWWDGVGDWRRPTPS